MQFERVKRGNQTISRRIQVPAEIRQWAKVQTALDTRAHGKKATLLDVYLGMVTIALPERKKIAYRQITVTGQPSAVMMFPKSLYNDMVKTRDEIKAGKAESDGTYIDIMDVFQCLLEHGYKQITNTNQQNK